MVAIGMNIGLSAGGGGSGKTPDQVTGLWAWWKADAGTSTTTDGVGVSQWDDQSGNVRHLVQATGGNQPVYKTSIVNGKPVLRFTSSSSHYLSISSITSPGEANPSDLSIFVVAQCSVSGTKALVATRDGGANGWLLRFTATGSLFGHLGGTNATDTFTPTGAFNVVEVVRTGLSAVLGHNGTMTGGQTVTAYPGASTRLNVGMEDTASGASVAVANAFDGDIAEIAIYTTPVSTADRDDLETGFASKYGITVA